MGTPLVEALAQHEVIGIDSCVLIYHLEGHERFGPPAREVLEWIEAGRATGVVATLALLELQVGPYGKGARDRADYYFAALRGFPNFRWVDLSYAIADLAAQIRAARGASVPDSIHLATAVRSEATGFVTNDQSLPALPGLRYVLLGR